MIDLSPEIYGSYARDNAECLAMSVVTMPFVKITQLCMVCVPLMCSPVFVRSEPRDGSLFFALPVVNKSIFFSLTVLFWSLLLFFVA